MIFERIKSERERAGLTQPALAQALGVGKTTIINWEKGLSMPTATHLELADQLGFDTLYIITGRRSEVHNIEPSILGAIVYELQKYQEKTKTILPADAARKAAIALLDLVEGDEQKVESVAKTVLKLVA